MSGPPSHYELPGTADIWPVHRPALVIGHFANLRLQHRATRWSSRELFFVKRCLAAVDRDVVCCVPDSSAAVGFHPQSGCTRVGATQPMIFPADETTDIGYESVTADYTARGSRFTGKINWVQIDLGGDDHDHSSTPTNASASLWPAAPADTCFAAGRYAPPRVKRCFGDVALFDMSISGSFLGDGQHAGLSVFGAAAVRVKAQRRTIRM
jgi:hypothetical protein